MRANPELLQVLSGDEFEELVQALVVLEMTHAGLELHHLETVSYRTDGQGDGGVDALVMSAPPRPTARIPGRWVFQAKASLDLGKLKQQLKKQARALKLLRDGAGYTLAVNAHLDAEETLPALKALLKEVTGKSVQCRVLAREHVAGWVSEHPAAWSLVPGLGGRGLQTFESWARRAGTERLLWTPDEPRVAGASALVALSAGSIFRVVGAPGVGKTRFVLEALRTRAREVSHLPLFTPHAEELVAGPTKGVLVVDECSDQEHDRLRALHQGDVTLITIGLDARRGVTHPDDVLLLRPLSASAMRQIASRARSSVSRETLHELAALSGGYPKYFDVLVQAVGHSPTRPAVLSLASVGQMTDRLLAELTGHLAAVRALAAPQWVDLSPGTTDAEALAQAAGVSVDTLQRALEALFKHGLAGRNDHLWYLTPTILAERLALDFWGEFPKKRLLDLIEAGAETDLVSRCMLRLQRGSAEARGLLVDLARDRQLLEQALTQTQKFQLLQELADQSPQHALELVESLLRPGVWTDELGVTLARIARSGACFERAATLLIRHFIAAPEGAPGGLILDLFASHRPLTNATSAQRLSLLEELARAEDAATRTIAAQAARTACTRELTFAAGGWESRTTLTHEQEQEFRLGAVRVLGRLMQDEDSGVRSTAVHGATTLIRSQAFDGFPKVALALVAALVDAKAPLEDVRRAVATIREFDVETEEDATVVAQLDELLAPRSLTDHYAQLLSSWRFDERAGAEIELSELGRRLVAEGDIEAVAFLSRYGPGRFQAGIQLARADSRLEVLPHIRHALAKPDASTLFAAGYLNALSDDEADAILDEWAVVPSLATMVVDLTARQNVLTTRRIDRLSSLASCADLKSGWIKILEGRYLNESTDARRRLRPLITTNPLEWLRLATSAALTDKDKAWAADELATAWTAAFHLAHADGAEWEYATRELEKLRPETIRLAGLRELESPGRFPEQLLDFAHVVINPWADFARLLERLSPDAQVQASRTLRTRAHGVTPNEVLGWIGRDEQRLMLVATMAPSVSAHDNNLAAALLDSFPDHDGLARVVFEHHKTRGFPSGVVFDATARAADAALNELRAMADSPRFGLSRFARRYVSAREDIARKRHGEEEAFHLGIRFNREPGEKISQAVYRLAEAQSGYFTAAQAKEVGCSAQLLRRYQQTGKVVRHARSVYRLGQFPRGEHEELVVLWLWSESRGVFSHTTALSLHGISNVMPDTHEMTLPLSQEHRRFRIPDGVRLHFADVPKRDRLPLGAIWFTSVERTLADCEQAGLSPELLREARQEARRKGLAP